MRKKKSYPKQPKSKSVAVLKRWKEKVDEVAKYNKTIQDEADKRKKLNDEITKLKNDLNKIQTAPFKKPKSGKRPRQRAAQSALERYIGKMKDVIKTARDLEREANALKKVKDDAAKMRAKY